MIKLLCVGLGGMGYSDWNAAAAGGSFDLVAGVDTKPAARKRFTEETGKPAFSEFPKALREAGAEAALIATPDALHAPMTIAALERGLDVICEKPMAPTLREAKAMHRAAGRRKRLLMIHHQLRWATMFRKARELIAAGAVGNLLHVDYRVHVLSGVCFNGYRRRLKQLILQDLGIHHFDLLRYMTGMECLSITVRSWSDVTRRRRIRPATSACAVLDMDGGVTVTYRSSMRALDETTGYHGAAVLRGDKATLSVAGGKVVVTEVGRDGARDVPLDPPQESPMQAFAQAIRTRQPALTDSEDNIRSVELLFAAIRSADSGKTVRLNRR